MARVVFKRNFLHPRYWLLWLGLIVLWLLVLLPYKWLRKLGAGFGGIVYYLAGSRRRIVERNLELCFPEMSAEDRKQITKRNFAAMGIAFAEMAISWWWPKKRLSKLIKKVEGLEHIQLAQQEKQGVILLALHFTTLEIGAAMLATLCPLTGMYREHGNAFFDYIQRSGRERMNPESEAIERDDIRAMARVLKNGETIWYAPDQDYGAKRSVFVPLFGIPAATVTATTKFARLTKAKVIPFVQKPLADGSGYELIIYPPLDNFPSESEQVDCLIINQWVEKCVKEQIDQYLWAHRRFKTRPEGEPSLYKKK
ncbi:lipid A biosynthesis lauroyl acyltransferase [Entomomonas asaccharolytica]|uniref:Lipid A biosynthesis acyltransferase n=1 Tax=Entomomonas asaccharolytica TaxID=2785331 RepID=A0A974RW79_9GAMM|nr:lipid A biosynthesis lauroyl acyltransferase [Entomomonas asaccharolytica]QQP84918.1 lipid A biosynthesis lauroyl acyltransferase [Entomomonas asaccharolytica]